MTGTIKGLSYTLHNTQLRAWGFEIPATFVDAAKNEHNVVLLFRSEPTEETILEQVSFWADKIIAQSLLEPDVNETLLKSEVEELLRLKGYLTAEQSLEDLPDKEVAAK